MRLEGDLEPDMGRFVFAVTAREGSTTRRIMLACESKGEGKEWVTGLKAHSQVPKEP